MVDKWLLMYAAVFAGGLILALLFTPFFRFLAHKTGFLDRPADNHKGHARATALLGGAAMFTAWIIAILSGVTVVLTGALPQYFADTLPRHIGGFQFALVKQLSFIILGAFLAVVLGLIDDKWALKAKWKFLGHREWGGH